MDNTHANIESKYTARVSRRGVLTAGALGIAASLTVALRAAAHPFPTVNQTNEEDPMTAINIAPKQTTPSPTGPGSVSGAPNLPAGFTDTFTSQYVDTGEVRLHTVTGGAGPPLLLVHGWPQTWYAWRML